MKMAVFMDEISSIKAYKDSSVAMLKSAYSLGIECFYFTQTDLYSKDGKAFARVAEIVIIDENLTDFAQIKSMGVKNLADFDIILVRKDPPFTMEYIYAMQILALAEKDGVLVANKPATICLANEKINILNYPDCIPPSIVTSNKGFNRVLAKTSRCYI